MNKYEQLIEHIINDDEAKARALFHQIVVEKSRDIYESLMDEEYAEEDIHAGNPVEGMVDEITADETMQAEGNDEFDLGGDDMGDDDMGMDDMGGDDMDMDDMDGEGDLESKVMDLESELEALKAEFEALMGNDSDEENGNDMMDMGGDEEGDDSDEENGNDMMEAADEDEEDKEEDEDEEMTESVQRKAYPKTAVDLMREYVEKVAAPSNTEFTPAGTSTGGDKAAGNTKGIVAGKNDMGGTSQNIAKGSNETAPDGQSPNGKAGGFLKNAQEIDVAKRNVNKPGGNKGAQDWYGTKAAAKKGEDGGTNKTSIETGGN
jgi:hypothetical protein